MVAQLVPDINFLPLPFLFNALPQYFLIVQKDMLPYQIALFHHFSHQNRCLEVHALFFEMLVLEFSIGVNLLSVHSDVVLQ